MAIADTYDNLVASVQEVAEDDSAEFVAFIPKAISLAEERLTKELDTLGTKFSDSVVTSSGTETVTKPSGYRLPFDLRIIDGSGIRRNLIKKTDDYLIDYWPDTTQTDLPKYYAEVDMTTLMLAPVPDSTYTIEFSFLKRHDPLGPSNQTNYLTEFCQDALFYATMVAMTDYMKHWEAVEVWSNRYNTAIEGLNNEGRRARTDDNSRVDNPEGGQNTLMKNNP